MIEVNIASTLGDLIGRLSSLDKSKMLREAAVTAMGEIRHRVHVNGEDSEGSQIGTYSKGYMKVRTGQLPNVYTKGRNKGNTRKQYNRLPDTKVILSLTRQMEDGMAILDTPGGVGIGYHNSFDYNKAIWNEKRLGKPIWKLSTKERELVHGVAEEHTKSILNND